MKRRSIVIFIVVSSVFAFGFYTGSRDALYFKINKSLEIFGSLFREVSEKYVDDIDPEEFIKSGAAKMLGDLDPYTAFIGDGGSDDIDALTTGSYIGFGISVGQRDSMTTITEVYDGYSAQQNGARVGDRILRIDSSFVLRETSEGLRKFSRGEVGTKAVLQLLRGARDTISATLTRQVIRVTNVSYAGVLPQQIGYIKLDRFSRRAAEEIRSALGDLKTGRQLNGIVLDLRDNPGGLLESAVEVCEIFVPLGSRIVATRGRDSSNQRVYTSKIAPTEPNLPLAILINGNSASASEVVAGAIQDLDRGVIVGERSFGKGLVQNVFPLPYNSSVKITTAKYYTPSGRCIQTIDFAKRRAGLNARADSVRSFYTKSGRVVRELRGIEPDTLTSSVALSDFMQNLVKSNSIFLFANDYAAGLNEFDEGARRGIVKEFVKWLDNNGGMHTTALDLLGKARKASENEKMPRSVSVKFDALERTLRKEKHLLIKENGSQLRNMLEVETYRRLASRSDCVAFSLESDNIALTAARIINAPIYRSILAASEINGEN